MQLQDVFVGSVSIAIGLLALAAAIGNWEVSFQLRAGRWFERRWGRMGARVAYAVLGASLIALGIALAAGFGPNRG
ncbi:MAG: hypothetical protein J5I93_16275 [Pirellulaceae bacterium]|nr:hypothetical protein [Pirellulaceae bacterium]